MTDFLAELSKDNPNIKFVGGQRFSWSPSAKTIYYTSALIDSDRGKFTLLHELSHAQLRHNHFKSDLELLQMEVSAWQHAKQLAKSHNIAVSDDYIEECLESYRDWLYKRSMCVECSTNSMQDEKGVYHCHICGTSWSVPSSQLCRIQRRKVKKN